jgi:hypothetical protein
MADYLSLINPFAATNYVINSSMEAWSAGPVPTGWTNYNSATLSADSTYTWRGANSCKIVSASAASRGITQDVVGTNTQSYRCSAYVYIVSGSVSFVAYDYGGTSNPISTSCAAAGWQRVSLTKVAASGGLRLRIATNAVAATFYVDAVQVEDGTVTTTYIDGFEPGCYWNGTPHASTATRDGQSREGGKIVPFNTLCDGIVDILGAGMPSFNNISIPRGLIGGSQHQRTVPQARSFTVELLFSGTSLDNLHSKFLALENLIKYDLVTPEQPVKLLYNDQLSTTTLTIHAVYDGGLEGQTIEGADNHLYMTVAIRFLADDPCWYDDRQSCVALGYSSDVLISGAANYVLQRPGIGSNTGKWATLKYGVDDVVYSMVYAPDGSLYVGGKFLTAGIAAAEDTVVNCIARWYNGTWSDLHVGANIGVDGLARYVAAMAVGPDGCLYIGGSFALAGAVANTANVAKWDGTVFIPLDKGLNNAVGALVFGPDGCLYAGGDFTADGNATPMAHVAKWNGVVWTALAGGVNAVCNDLVFGPDNYLYATGNFTDAGTRIAKWSGAAWSALGSGLNVTGHKLIFGLDKILYVTGVFTTAGGIACNYIAGWNGTAFAPLGSGLNAQGFSLAIAPNGNLYVGGVFTSVGGVTVPDSVAIWTGSAWLPIDVDFPGAPTDSLAILFDPRGNLYVGFGDEGSATSATVTTSTNASTKTYPKFVIYHYNASGATAKLYQIINYTIGRAIYFNNLTVLNGETIYLETMPGKVNLWSVYRGSLNNYILSMTDWYLQPGANNVSAYLVGGTASSSINMLYNNAYWSFSGDSA